MDNNNKVYINSYGERVLRVSEVLKTLNKEQLLKWSNMLGFKHIRYEDELERTSNIGTMVHDFIENFTTFGKLATYNYSKFKIRSKRDKREADNAIDSFLKWYYENKSMYKIIDHELTIVGDDYGGTIDAILESPFNHDHVIILDYKTGSGIYFSMFLQLAAYTILYEKKYGKTVDAVAIMKMDKVNGDKAKCKYIKRDDLNVYIKCFKSLLNTTTLINTITLEFKNHCNKFNKGVQ